MVLGPKGVLHAYILYMDLVGHLDVNENTTTTITGSFQLVLITYHIFYYKRGIFASPNNDFALWYVLSTLIIAKAFKVIMTFIRFYTDDY